MKTTKSTKTFKITTVELVYCGMFSALLAVISQISIPFPTGVPITIQIFGVALAGTVLGWKLGLITTIVYILLGAAGLPVFSNFRGGIQVLTGIAGGYVLAWPIMAALCGLRIHKNSKLNLAYMIFFGLLGLALVEILGAVHWFIVSGNKSLGFIMAYSLTAFVPKDIILTVAGILIGRQILKRR